MVISICFDIERGIPQDASNLTNGYFLSERELTMHAHRTEREVGIVSMNDTIVITSILESSAFFSFCLMNSHAVLTFRTSSSSFGHDKEKHSDDIISSLVHKAGPNPLCTSSDAILSAIFSDPRTILLNKMNNALSTESPHLLVKLEYIRLWR